MEATAECGIAMQSTTLGRQDFPVKSILLRWGDVGRSSVSAFAEVIAGTSEPRSQQLAYQVALCCMIGWQMR
jgi:hypothetical protein